MWDGKFKNGKPRTDAERKKRHSELYGEDKLPPRGTGRLKDRLKKRKLR